MDYFFCLFLLDFIISSEATLKFSMSVFFPIFKGFIFFQTYIRLKKYVLSMLIILGGYPPNMKRTPIGL